MSEKIKLYQVQVYMNARKKGFPQGEAADLAGFSTRSGQRIEAGDHQPNRGRVRDWRSSPDPLLKVWDTELEPMLKAAPRLQPMTLFEVLQERHPGKYPQVLRTLQRRVAAWKALHGDAPEVMFELRHEPGMMGLSDFTELKGTVITIAGKPFEHLLYHYRLAYSGWQYVQVIQGGESFVGLSQGLQNALIACGGVPQTHRTDSLSAAYRNTGGRNPQLTQMYAAICDHYRMRPTRNNTGVAHENGSIEASHGHFKRRLCQALYRRESHEFKTVAEYQSFIESVIAKINAKCSKKVKEEQPFLQALPRYRTPDYEVLSVRVSCHSTITVRCVLYTVPSRLTEHRLTVHLYHDRLVGFVGTTPVVDLPRLHIHGSEAIRRGRAINYRHVAESLRRKPRAFLYCQWQQELLPDSEWRDLWQQLKARSDPDQAARLIVEALYIAATQNNEVGVLDWLQLELEQNTLTLTRLQQAFSTQPHPDLIPSVTSVQHELTSYDELLRPAPIESAPVESASDIDPSPQTTQIDPLPLRVADNRTSSDAGELVVLAVPAGVSRRRSQSARPSPDCPRAHRSAVALRKILV